MLQYKDLPKKLHAESIIEASLKLTSWVVLEYIPITKMDTLIPVLKNAFGDSELCKSFNQGRTKTSGIVRHVIAPVERDVFSCELKKAHISLIVDESTDKSWQKVLVLIAKHIQESKDIVQKDFLGLLPVSDDSSEGEKRLIFGHLESLGIPLQIRWRLPLTMPVLRLDIKKALVCC
jgi:hypothetical protein